MVPPCKGAVAVVGHVVKLALTVKGKASRSSGVEDKTACRSFAVNCTDFALNAPFLTGIVADQE